jgi:hypothetical protein
MTAKRTKFARKAKARAKRKQGRILHVSSIVRWENDPVQKEPPGKGPGTHWHDEPVVAGPRGTRDAQWLLDNGRY